MTATLAPPAYVVAQPRRRGALAYPAATGETVSVEFAVSPRRWGVRSAGTSMFAATSPWGGYRWGPQRLPEATIVALPETPALHAPARARTRSG